mgnify:CR=1 FL=1
MSVFKWCRRKTFFVLVMASSVIFTQPNPSQAQSLVVVKGIYGESISINTNSVKAGSTVIVQGTRFDESVGIYLAYCVLPLKGKTPTPCGGGVNKTGIGDASYWISSNPPPYGKGLAIPFQPGGRFREKVLVSRKIGTFDCAKVKCAITVRADHLLSEDRSHDIFIPITIR